MKCPVCNVALTMSERQGIEIDYCPQCRGVWLDRGELDKIIERSAALSQRELRERPESPRDYREKEDYSKHKHYKRKSFLAELFD
ncbi:MAG: zf-TFIIB domain-containing protein [Thermodesulfobacteriota bacterium]